MIRLKALFCLVVLLSILQACGIIIGNAQSCPTVCVIIPETVIIHAFLDYGFHIVDQNQDSGH